MLLLLWDKMRCYTIEGPAYVSGYVWRLTPQRVGWTGNCVLSEAHTKQVGRLLSEQPGGGWSAWLAHSGTPVFTKPQAPPPRQLPTGREMRLAVHWTLGTTQGLSNFPKSFIVPCVHHLNLVFMVSIKEYIHVTYMEENFWNTKA